MAFIPRPATRQPSTSLCGSPRRISRSLHVPGSPSSAFTTRYRGLAARVISAVHTHPRGDAPLVLRPAGLVHEAPLEPAREARAAAAAQARILDRLDDPRIAFEKDLFRAVPVPARLCPRLDEHATTSLEREWMGQTCAPFRPWSCRQYALVNMRSCAVLSVGGRVVQGVGVPDRAARRSDARACRRRSLAYDTGSGFARELVVNVSQFHAHKRAR